MENKTWRDDAAQYLNRYELAQLDRAIAQPLTAFHERVIGPQFFARDRGFYLSLQRDQYAEGRNHLVSEKLFWNPQADFSEQTYFTNPLSFDRPAVGDNGQLIWTSPKSRVVLGDFQVFTFEFDDPTITFLKRQLGWLRSSKHPLDCPVGDLFRTLQEFVDFAGITVNWSGNKSLHIHIVFSTSVLTVESGVRAGHRAHWAKLKNIVMETLDPGIEPDPGMDQAERYRRLPNGSRKLDKPNLFGTQVGETVPQITLWEKYLDRAPRGSRISFFDPMLFVDQEIDSRRKGKRIYRALDYRELDYCADKMREFYPGGDVWPAFDHWTNESGELRARFANSPFDRHPASYMDLDFRTVNIVGSNPLFLTPREAPRLPKPLGDMVADWLDEFEAIHGKLRSPAELQFAETVTNAASGAKAIRRVLFEAIRDHDLAFICAPEGVAKTSTLFRNHARIAAWVARNKFDRSPSKIMFAFSDYRAAYEKAQEFNTAQANSRFHAIVIESFDRAYAESCARLKIMALSLGDAARMGCTSILQAIERLQPEVIADMSQRHSDLWLEVGNREPVFFTVHAVAQKWSKSAMTRLMAAPSFWEGDRSTDHTALCRSETAIGLLIHDEIKSNDLVAAYRFEVVEWVEGLRQSDPAVWDGSATAVARFQSYSRYVDANPDPIVNGKPRPVSLDEVLDIVEPSIGEWEDVLTQDSGEYQLGEKSIYGERVDQVWRMFERTWPTSTQTVVLTTEAVPLALARHGQLDWTVYDLDAPRVHRDYVETQLRKGLRSADLPTTCAAFRLANPEFFIISNKVATLPATKTHASARGSNELMETSICQTMVFVSPDEFEYLEALNAWTGRDDLIRHRHVDEFNQTAGRNLGFRKREGTRHVLLINETLFHALTGQPRARTRYDMRIEIDRRIKRKSKMNAKTYAVPIDLNDPKQRMAAIRETLRSGSHL